MAVDDEPDLCALTKDFLEMSSDVKVDTFFSVRDARIALAKKRYDVIVSDYQMPGEDGIQFLKSLRAVNDMTPFILFTGKGREDVVIEALNSGADAYLQKGGMPTPMYTELEHRIRLVVDKCKGDREIERNSLELQLVNEKLAMANGEINIQAEELRNANHALEGSRDKYIDLYDFAPLGYITLNEKGLVTEANLTGATLLKIGRNKLINARFRKFIAEKDSDPWYRYFKNMLNEKEKLTCDLTIKRGDGSFFLGRLESICILDIVKGERMVRMTISDITDIKKVEQALRHSEESSRLLLANLSTGVVVHAIDTSILFSNPMASNLLGLTEDQMRGKTAMDPSWRFLREDGMPLPLAEYPVNRVLSLQEPFKDVVLGIVRPDRAELTWVLCSAYPMYDKGTKPHSIVVTFTDITESKRAELELRYAREQLEEAHHLARIGTWDWLAETDSVVWSEELYRIAGRDTSLPAPALAEQESYYTPASWKILYTAVSDALATGQPYHLELEMVRTDGSNRQVIAIGTAKLDVNEKIIGLRGILQDITERKRAEETLHRQNEMQQTILDSIPVMVGLFDHKGRYQLINRCWQTTLGWSLEEMLQHENLFADFYPDPEYRKHVFDYIKKAEGSGHWSDFKTRVRDGRMIDTSWINVPLSDGSTIGIGMDITERKRAEESLKESINQFKQLSEVFPETIFESELDGKITYVNEHGLKQFDIDSTDIANGLNFFDLIVPSYKQLLISHISEILGGMEGKFIEFKALKKDRTTMDVYAYSVPIVKDGRPIGVRGFALDITSRKRMEEALRESEEKFREIFNNANDGIQIHEMHEDGTPGRFIEVNDVICRMLGYTREELLQRRPTDNSTGYYDPSIEKVIESLRATGSARIETELRRKDGSTISVEANDNILDLNGRSVMIGVIRDITERKRAEEALKESTDRFKQLAEIFPETIFEADLKGNVTYINDHGLTQFELDASDIANGVNILDFVAPSDRQKVISRVSERIDGKKGEFLEYHAKRKNGAIFDALSFSVRIVRNGNPAGIRGFILDITEQKRAEESLKQANRKLNLLSSITRHDINNQLMVLGGNLTLLEKKQMDDQHDEHLRKAEIATERISAMIKFTQEYEEIGVKEPTWQDVRTLVRIASEVASLNKMRVVNNIPASTEVFADPLIGKVFQNLMQNALQHGGCTTIRFSLEEKDGVRFIVGEDDGVGIPAEMKRKLFAKGFGKNTGLGLFLSREILAITGITITEEGKAGHGARFVMTIPSNGLRELKTSSL